MELVDIGAERAVLSGLFKYGDEVYVDISDIISASTFSHQNNQILYKCIEKILSSEQVVDVSSILAASKHLGYYDIISAKPELEYIKSLMEFPIKKENALKFAAQIKKFEFAREIKRIVRGIAEDVDKINGDESVDEILALLEDPITNFLKEDGIGQKTEKIWDGLEEYYNFVCENPCDQVGISSGMARFDTAIGGGLRRKCIDLVAARPKAQPYTANVLTPDGWKRMGDVVVGDVLCRPNGGVSKVTNIIEQGDVECFRFTFDDGVSTEACGDHLWKLKSRRWKNFEVYSWNQIKNSVVKESDRLKWQFPMTGPVYRPRQEVLIHPYVLGVILGDGGISTGSILIASNDDEIVENVRKLLPEDLVIDKKEQKYMYIVKNTILGGRNRYITELTRLGLMGLTSHNKFIPQEYLMNDQDTRISILQGLLDTDGSVQENGSIEYSTTSNKLANDVRDLVMSLGGKCKLVSRYTSYEPGGKRFLSYRLYIRFNNASFCFRLSRKMSRCKQRKKPDLKRKLASVVSTGVKQSRCITIDKADGLYITDDYIVTHNCGKTIFADNVALNVAMSGIPVLMLDTEMSKEDHINRIIANLSDIPINEFATGKFSDDKEKSARVRKSIELIKTLPYTYASVAGSPFENIVNTIKKWIVRDVGKDENGRVKDCLVVYDYLKLMSSSSITAHLQEHQVLGFQITALHNLAVKFDFPCLAFVQLNRDGITKESTDAVSGSDRLVWLCTSFSIFKKKSAEEYAEDGPSGGNRKFVTIASRHGPGTEDGDYINMNVVGDRAILREVKSRNELINEKAIGGAIEGAGETFAEEDYDEEPPFDTDS